MVDTSLPGSEPCADELTVDSALELLTTGELTVEGRLVDASNATLYCAVTSPQATAGCVYKPVRGERPLWDFPDGTLAGREVAAYLVDGALGWELIPPTVLRDGPFGVGMCQLWIDTQPVEQLVDLVPQPAVPAGWFPVLGGEDSSGQGVVVVHADDIRLRRLALLDAVTNNADRKGGHLLLTADGHLYGVDHGICFHSENKLRTLLWGWAGKPLDDEAVEALERLHSELDADLGDALAEHLTGEEIGATTRRVERLLRTGKYPKPGGRRPAVPWPPF